MTKQPRSPIPWIGGKYYSAARILQAFPAPQNYNSYVEPFGGAAHVLFRKPKFHHVEVYNDANGDLTNFWMTCRDNPEELQAKIDSLPYSRQLHDNWHQHLFSDPSLDDLERAVQWFYVLRGSFGGILNKNKNGWGYTVRRRSVGSSTSSATRLHTAASLFKSVSERFHDIQIEHRGFEKVITTYDSPTTMFYCDPPYIGKEHYYEYKDLPRFTEADHRRLALLLNAAAGMIALSYYPNPLIDELYPKSKWRRITWTTPKLVSSQSPNRPLATEMLLLNYPPDVTRGMRHHAN